MSKYKQCKVMYFLRDKRRKSFLAYNLNFITGKKLRLFFLAIIIAFSSTLSYTQEIIHGLSVNPELVKINKEKNQVKQLRTQVVPDSIGLPFIDDFSTTTIYPDPNLWIDKQAYINSTYPINPVTIGVATLDALDENGQLYKNATSSPFSADTLTSKPFKLNIKDKTKDDFYFSFYYQPQGLGDKPETGDSLIVEFYNPSSLKWKKVWPDLDHIYKPTTKDSVPPFKQAIISVAPEYKISGFQFRFRNYASIDGSDVPGRHGNADQWNIDYVRLDTGRNANDTALKDIAFVKPLTSLLKTYQSMPWNQYKIAFTHENKPTIDITYKNNGTDSLSIGRQFRITEISDSSDRVVKTDSAGHKNIEPYSTVALKANLFRPFAPKYPGKLVRFDVESYLTETNDSRHQNDTIHYTQIFSNYYAYDDGSSEAGYGLIGEGAQNAMAAFSFNAYEPDTLTGISFYFNSTALDTTSTYPFTLAVWSDNNGQPGDYIYKNDHLVTPKKPELLNQFFNFKLDSGILVNGQFYVGFVQESDNFLNIGFDLNNNNQSSLFVNFNGIWTTSTIAGTLMMRPVFRQTKEGPVSVKKIPNSQSFSIYPNPADNQIYINLGNHENSLPLSLEIYNITGKLVLSTKLQKNTLDVSMLANGLYFLKLSGGKVNFQPVKLLIQR